MGIWRYRGCGSQKLLGPQGSVVCLSERCRHSDLQPRHVATCRSASDVSPKFVVEPVFCFLFDTWTTHSRDMLAKWIKKPEQQAAASSSSSSSILKLAVGDRRWSLKDQGLANEFRFAQWARVNQMPRI